MLRKLLWPPVIFSFFFLALSSGAGCSDSGEQAAAPEDPWTQANCEAEGGGLKCVDTTGTECATKDRGEFCTCECRIPTAGPEECEALGGVPFCLTDKTGMICWEDTTDVDCRCRCAVGAGVIGAPCTVDEDCLDALMCSSVLNVCVRRCFEDRHCNGKSCVDSSYCSPE